MVAPPIAPPPTIDFHGETILSAGPRETPVADGIDPMNLVVLVAMVIGLGIVGIFEVRYLRKRRQKRESSEDLPDRAHNAILTAKAIAEALARGGVRSPEADEIVREAEAAVRERNYRVAIDLTERAKSVLRAAKLKEQQRGDLGKLESIKPKGEAEEVTAKERLMKDLPPNYAQSKFSINLARDEIASARARGQDTSKAEGHLADAQASFDEQDYEVALKHAVRSRRALEPNPAAPPPEAAPPSAKEAPPQSRACPNCGAPVAADDAFCRKCGAPVPKARTCPSCGSPVADADAFCRKCGTPVPR